MAESDQVHNLTGASQSAELEHPVPALTRESTGQSVSGKPSSGLSFQLGKRNPSSARINEILEVCYSLSLSLCLHPMEHVLFLVMACVTSPVLLGFSWGRESLCLQAFASLVRYSLPNPYAS